MNSISKDNVISRRSLEVKIPISSSDVKIPLNFKEICRACLLENSTMIHFSSKEQFEGNPITVSEILTSFSNITEIDGLSNVICTDCLQSVRFTYCFKLQCERADILLKQYFGMIIKKDDSETKYVKEEVNSLISDMEDMPLSIYSEKIPTLEEQYIDVNSLNANIDLNCDKKLFLQKEENNTKYVSKMDTPIGSHCEICGKLVRCIQRHMKRHKGRHFTCETCGKSYPSQYDLSNHLKTHSKERPHKCKICFKGFCHTHRLKEHMLRHNNKREFICELCGKGFNVYKQLAVHMSGHSGIKPYQCNLCNKSYTSSEKLKIHLRSHTGEKKFVCDYCRKPFASKEPLKAHLRIHTGEKPYICDAEGCERKFTTQQSLLMHKPVHSDERPFPCFTCGKRFARMSDWRKHESIHTSGSKLACPQDGCQRTFTNPQRLKDHTDSHSTDKRALCTTCGKSFTRKSDLTRHIRTHSQERPFKCPQCGVGFNQQFGLTQHLIRHTGESPFICDMCGKGFNRKCSMKKHKMVHSGIKNYECEHCEMKFLDCSQLLRHKRTHTGERPYKCEVCDKAFAARSSYVVHLRKHTGQRPYQCHLCDKACATSTALKIHLRNHTGEKPYVCPQCGTSFSRSDLRSLHMKSCCPNVIAEPVNQAPLKYFLHQKSSGVNYLQVIPQSVEIHQTNCDIQNISMESAMDRGVLEHNILPTESSLLTPHQQHINELINQNPCDQGVLLMQFNKL